MGANNKDPLDTKKYWESFSPEEKKRFRKLIGIGSREKPAVEQIEIWREFDATRKRIREIEQRARKKLRGQ